MEVVNGYVCKTCCDVDLAKRNINPADPEDDVHNPKSPNFAKAEDPHHPGKPLPAWESASVTFSGLLAKVRAASETAGPDQASSATRSPYSPGSMASVSA